MVGMHPANAHAVKLINGALEIYRQTHVVPPEAELEVRQDFARFNLEVMKLGLRGIRWNFNGCIACKDHTLPVRLKRILLVDPFTVAAAGGRGLGTVVCEEHEPAMDSVEGLATTIIPGALRRIAEEPPISTAAA